MTAPDVLVVGFDAMDASLALELVEAGRMPNLAALLDAGTHAPVKNATGLVVGSVWPTFATGAGPGRHGFYCFRQLVAGRYEIRRFTPHDVHGTPYWDALSDAGLRCATLDAPLMAPSERINGVHIVDWGSHDRMLETTVMPATERPLLESVPRHPIEGKCDDYARSKDWSGLLEALESGIRRRTDLALTLLGRERWDVLTVVFAESHCAGHQFWALHDHSHERADSRVREQLGCDPLERVYEACDAALGELVAEGDGETSVFVILSHGFGPHADGDHLLAEILERIENTRWPRLSWRAAREYVLRGLQRGRRGLQQRLRPNDAGRRRTVSVDGSRRLFKVPNNELYGGVRVNLAGREPRGFVRPGDEYQTLLTQLTAELMELRDPDDDRPLVSAVYRTDDEHPGPLRSWLPDLLVDWNRDLPITGAASPAVGVVRGRYTGLRTGDHRPDGLLAVTGPGVSPRRRHDPIRMIDVAPTICAAAGGELQGGDGVVVLGLVGDHPAVQTAASRRQRNSAR